jgi:hypothetical protein
VIVFRELTSDERVIDPPTQSAIAPFGEHLPLTHAEFVHQSPFLPKAILLSTDAGSIESLSDRNVDVLACHRRSTVTQAGAPGNFIRTVRVFHAEVVRQ